MSAPGFSANRHAVEVDGVTLATGPGHMTPREAGDMAAAYVNANPGAVAVTVRNYVRHYPAAADAEHAGGSR